jgi:hypothetical protein
MARPAARAERKVRDRSFGKARADRNLAGRLTANKVIVTVPTNLIADESIRFHPALPAKVDARADCRSDSLTR